MKGKRIAVLEARLGRQLAELVEGRGGVPFHAPALAEVPDLDAGALAARGAEVVEIPTYRWSLPQDTQPLRDLIGALERHELHAAVFTNAEQVRNLFAVAKTMGKMDALRQGLNTTIVASIGPVASAALREAQVKVSLEASPPKLGALLAALEAALK